MQHQTTHHHHTHKTFRHYNKTTAAVVAGAIVTVGVAVATAYSEQLAKVLQEPGVQAALQTIVTALVVFFAPANDG